MKLKNCSKCGLEKSRSEFTKDARAKDGRRSECKTCRHAYSRDYYLRRQQQAEKLYGFRENHGRETGQVAG